MYKSINIYSDTDAIQTVLCTLASSLNQNTYIIPQVRLISPQLDRTRPHFQGLQTPFNQKIPPKKFNPLQPTPIYFPVFFHSQHQPIGITSRVRFVRHVPKLIQNAYLPSTPVSLSVNAIKFNHASGYSSRGGDVGVTAKRNLVMCERGTRLFITRTTAHVFARPLMPPPFFLSHRLLFENCFAFRRRTHKKKPRSSVSLR